MENKIRELSNANKRKRLLKRVVAFLSIVVLLFTVNSLKLTANTLSRVPACGLKKHIHKAKCYDGNGNLICGKVEHQHTDACYQVAPNDLTLEIEGDGVAVDEPSLDLSLSLDDGVLQVDDSALQLDDSLLELDNPQVNDAGSGAQTNTSQKPTYELGEKAKLSKIIKKTKLGVSIGEVNEVGVVDYDGTQASLLSIEQIDGDYIIAAARDFEEVDLAIIAADGIEVVRLVGGRVSTEAAEQTDQQIDAQSDAQTVELDVYCGSDVLHVFVYRVGFDSDSSHVAASRHRNCFRIVQHDGFDLGFLRIRELIACGSENLDSVVFAGIVRSGNHNARIRLVSCDHERNCRSGHYT